MYQYPYYYLLFRTQSETRPEATEMLSHPQNLHLQVPDLHHP